MKKGSVLVVEDNKNVQAALRILLERCFETVQALSSPALLPTQLRKSSPDVVLLDMNFSAGVNSGNEGLYWLSEIKKFDADLPVVLFTAYADIELAVRALKQGATDFVVKPWDNAKLVATLQAACTLRASRREVSHLRARQRVLNRELNRSPEICWGVSEPMQKLRRLVEKVAATDANILITGENGTGKELIAREIHRLSLRGQEALITVDMGAVSSTLFESELFGHCRGAFTDAKTARMGKFEAANFGTLFLDEIGNLHFPLQSKLLSALQTQQVVRVGDNHPVDVDVRLLCATNCDLPEAVRRGTFREDLLYRINTIPVEVPPLRKCRDDIPLLAGFFLQKYTKKYHKEPLQISAGAMAYLQSCHWPGNIRELQHTIEKAVILSESATLRSDDFGRHKSPPSVDSFEDMSLAAAEKRWIETVLQRYRHNVAKTAEVLGVSRPTLALKIKKYGL
ncbi:MAG: sigma-54 dependent transcriptional regulator [Prevotellaceae bacterium]|jgi:DNA-binding NtrC family response regulator|nr:sigma-54 dependent transcriptional regulator [Prevotellaceae bacterium]